MCSQKKNSIKNKILQYLVSSILFFTFTAGLFMLYRHRIKVQKGFFNYYLGVMSVDVDSGSIPETGEKR